MHDIDCHQAKQLRLSWLCGHRDNYSELSILTHVATLCHMHCWCNRQEDTRKWARSHSIHTQIHMHTKTFSYNIYFFASVKLLWLQAVVYLTPYPVMPCLAHVTLHGMWHFNYYINPLICTHVVHNMYGMIISDTVTVKNFSWHKMFAVQPSLYRCCLVHTVAWPKQCVFNTWHIISRVT